MDQRLVLQERLMSLKRDFSSITEYMDSAQSIADAFAAINNPLSENDLITCILRGLGPAFNKFVVSIQSQLHELTLTDLRVLLLKHEQWLFRVSSLQNPFVDPNSPLPFYASQHPYQISIGPEPSSLSNRSQGRNHNTQYRPSQTSKPPTNNQQTPLTTGPSTGQMRTKTGHIANRRCFTYQGSSPSNGNNTLTQSFVAGLDEENNQEETAPLYESWIADFASSSDSLTKAKPYEGGDKMMLGDGIAAGVSGIIIASLMMIIMCCCMRKKYSLHSHSTTFWRKKLDKVGHQNMEVFFKNCGSLAPKRYMFSDIKKMTNSFEEKLGEGGLGAVFKGQLHDGMLVAVNVGMDHISQIYFPHWIYKRLERNEDLGLHGVLTEERAELARKMIIVGLWCIQTNPLSRPSMSKVLDMLEGIIEVLEIPPKPVFSSLAKTPPLSSSTIVSAFQIQSEPILSSFSESTLISSSTT